MAAERAFLPAAEFCDTMRAEGLPLFSIESCAPVAEFDAIGITLSHELVATNVLEALDLAGIPLHAQDRGEDDLFVIGGGPCSYNPEPYAPFFDIFNIGEGEEALPEALRASPAPARRGACRADILRAHRAYWPASTCPRLYRWRDEEQAQQAGSVDRACGGGPSHAHPEAPVRGVRGKSRAGSRASCRSPRWFTDRAATWRCCAGAPAAAASARRA